MIRTAYLRVYSKVDAEHPYREHEPKVPGSYITITDFGLVTESMVEDAIFLEWNGETYVCPRRPRLRMLEALLGFRDSFPGITSDQLIPGQVAERAALELDNMVDDDPDIRSHIVSSPWHVPLRWFAAFDQEEREVYQDDNGENAVRFRTALSTATERMTHALDVVGTAGFQDSVVDPLRDLVDWMLRFPDDSVLELDYGSVSGLFSDGDLATDETAVEMRASLTALEDGDLDEAGFNYARAAGRWARAQSLAYMN
jgi:hypothetical protein